MSDFRLLGTHKTWEDWCGMLLGVLIILSPWFPTQTAHDIVDSDRSFIRSHYELFIDSLTDRYGSRAEAKKIARIAPIAA